MGPITGVKQSLALTALLVRDYDEAIGFYVSTLKPSVHGVISGL
jgi:hypothetical protein